MLGLPLDNNTIVHLIGFIINVVTSFYIYKSWGKFSHNIKYLIAVQTILSALTILAHNISLVLDSLEWLLRENLFCYKLPVLVLFFTSLSIFNITSLFCVLAAKITSNWKIGRSAVVLIFVGVLSISTVLVSPIFYTLSKEGWSFIKYKRCSGGNTKGIKIFDIVLLARYIFWLIILQFIVPAVIITNRLGIIFIHLCRGQNLTEKVLAESKDDDHIRRAFNIISMITMIVVVSVFFYLCRGDTYKSLVFMNTVSRYCMMIAVVVMCWPWFLVEIICPENANEEEICIVEKLAEEWIDELKI